jgi:hypothetical protein
MKALCHHRFILASFFASRCLRFAFSRLRSSTCLFRWATLQRDHQDGVFPSRLSRYTTFLVACPKDPPTRVLGLFSPEDLDLLLPFGEGFL